MLEERDLSRAQAGDPWALETLAEELWPVAFRVALAVLSDRIAAQDAAQDAVIAVLQGIGGIRSAQALPAYLRKTAARCAYREMQRRRREEPSALEDVPDLFWIADEDLDLRLAISQLSAEDRVPLLLRYGAGLNSEEIGAALGITGSAVRFRLMRGRARLRQALAPDFEGGVLPDAAQ